MSLLASSCTGEPGCLECTAGYPANTLPGHPLRL